MSLKNETTFDLNSTFYKHVNLYEYVHACLYVVTFVFGSILNAISIITLQTKTHFRRFSTYLFVNFGLTGIVMLFWWCILGFLDSVSTINIIFGKFYCTSCFFYNSNIFIKNSLLLNYSKVILACFWSIL
jgi:hypothetical protein